MKDKKCKIKGCENLINSKMNKSGLCSRCSTKKYKEDHKKEVKAYHKKHRVKYYQENKEKENKRSGKWQKENSDRVSKVTGEYYDNHKEYYKEMSKKHYEKDPGKRLEQTRLYQNKRYREDEGFKMRKKLGGALWKVIDYYIKTGRIGNPLKRYAIDWEGIIKQLSPIPKDRHKYHVDHIVPLCKFDLTNIEQIQVAFAPENHRWLLAKDNLRRDRKE